MHQLRLPSLLGLVGALAAAAGLHPDRSPAPEQEAAAEPAPSSCDGGSAVVDLVDGSSPADPAATFSAAGFSPSDWEAVDAGGEGIYRIVGDPSALALAVEALSRDPRVEVAECEGRSHALGLGLGTPQEPDDPLFPQQWHLRAAGAPAAWAQSLRAGAGAVVAVVDTGIAWRDDRRSGSRKLPDLAETDLMQGATFGRGLPEGLDDQGHGSHVAGTIAQSTDNGVGVAGMAPGATLLPVKVLGPDGGGGWADIAAGIAHARDAGANVINMSLGGGHSKVIAKAVLEARAAGVTVVCAAGNSARGRVDHPGADPGSFAVGASGPSGRRAFYGSWGKDLDITAPGGDLREDERGGGVLQNTIIDGDPSASGYPANYQGTSMATPHVAGAAALIAASGVNRPAEVEAVLSETARRPEGYAEGRSDDYGAGHLDAGAALAAASERYRYERAAAAAFAAALALSIAGLGAAWRRRGAIRAGAELAAFAAAALWVAGALGRAPAYWAAELLGVAAQGPAWILSAAPALAVALLLPQAARPIAAGVAAGTAALLLHGAAALPTLLLGLPGGPLADRAWLAAQGLAALGIAVAALRALPSRTAPQAA